MSVLDIALLLQATTPRSIWLSPLFSELMGDVLSNYVLFPLVLKLTNSYYLYSCILPYIASLGKFSLDDTAILLTLFILMTISVI